MDDLISRQAAIDALKNDMASLDHIINGMSGYDVRLDAYVSQRNQVNCDIDTINNIPPAQPKELDTLIKALEAEHKKLLEMQKAQPEIIRCKDCKFASGDSRICMKFGYSPIGELDFCAWAERRTDG